MSMMEKVRRPRTRPPAATPKEEQAWRAFTELAETMTSPNDETSPMVFTELDRLCNKGNPIAIKFKEALEISKFKPRLASEAPLSRPEPRRISLLQWGSPAKR
jgi:hypothetical protein